MLTRAVLALALSAALTAAIAPARAASPDAARPTGLPKPWLDASLPPDRRADLVLAQMTLDEKFRYLRADFGEKSEKKPQPVGALGSAAFIPALPRLGLPAIQEADAGLGVTRGGLDGPGATALPASMATAASFDPAVAYSGGAMIGAEARAKGFNVLLAGGMNLARDPRNGRNFEYVGEDPLLAGVMAGHAIRGVQDQQVVSTMKHFALNALESGRNTLSADIGEAALRESDLLAFELATAIGQPGAVMCAYNRVNTVYACEHDYLLNDVLKGEWGFKGFVMSDWGGVHSSAIAANAGLDQQSAGDVFDKQEFFGAPLRADLAAGRVAQARIDDMVRRILRTYFAHGLVDHPATGAAIDYASHARVSRDAAEAGAVLLRNEHARLPLAASTPSIAVIGGHADKGILTGGGSSSVEPRGGNVLPGLAPEAWPGPVRYQPSPPLAAIRARAKGAVAFADGRDIAAAVALAKRSTVAVVVVEQWAAEAFDRPDMALPDGQDALVAAVAKANPRTVVVLVNNGPVKMPWLQAVDSVLVAWYPGVSGGEAIARLLFGEVAPAGRLPVTWPVDEAQLPRPLIVGAGLPTGTPAERVDYAIEGADVGYRWFERKGLAPLYPFGFGLSYTTFGHSRPTAMADGDSLAVTVTVTNTGKRAGVDVPQLYVTLPGTPTPRRLAAFARVALAPGESREVRLVAEPKLLARFVDGRWSIPAGEFRVQVGHSATTFDGEARVVLQGGLLPALKDAVH